LRGLLAPDTMGRKLSASAEPLLGPLWGAFAAAIVGALFACADTALTSLSPARLGALARESAEPARASLERAVRRRKPLQARYTAGRLLFLGASVALFTWWLVAWDTTYLTRLASALAAVLALGTLLQGATAVGRRNADRVVSLAVRYLWPFEWLLLVAPVATVTRDLSSFFFRNREPERDPRISETEVEMMLDEGERSGLLPQGPAEMMRNVLDFSELTARDAMVPRTRAVAIELSTPFEEVLDLVRETGHSRYPVYRGNPDEVVGLLYAKDLFRVLGAWPQRSARGSADEQHLPLPATVADIIRRPSQLVYESQPLSSVLKEMRQSRQHLAVVVNEFGATIGIVTLEDVLEEIVGDIQDELDTDEAPIVELGDGSLLADAAVLLSDLSAYLGTEIDPEGQFDSLGGMLTEQLGHVPQVGTTIAAYGMRFVVRDADEKRVARVEIIRPLRPSMHPPGTMFSEPPPDATFRIVEPTASPVEPDELIGGSPAASDEADASDPGRSA